MKREIKSNSKCLKNGYYKESELDNYEFKNSEKELIMTYQKKFPELLSETDEEAFVIDGEVLCSQLGVKDNFNTWLLGNSKSKQGKLIKYRMVENTDYISSCEIVKREIGATKKNKIMLTLNCAKKIALRQNTEEGDLVCDYFILIEKAFKNRMEWNFDRDDSIVHCKQLQRAMMKYHGKLLGNKPAWARSVQQAEFALFNNVIIGMSASEYRKLNGMNKTGNIRNTFTEIQLEYVAELEKYDADLIMVQNIFEYEKRKEILTKKFILMCD